MFENTSKRKSPWVMVVALIAAAALTVFASTILSGCGGGGGNTPPDDPIVCNAPFVPNSAGTACVCPSGTHEQSGTCVPNTVADTTPPSVSLTAPAGGTTLSGTVTLTATATDNVGVTGVQFEKNGSALCADITSSPYQYSWDTTTASDGTYTITAYAHDLAGNTKRSDPITVTVKNTTTGDDTTPPTVVVTSPSNGANISGWATINATVTDNKGVASVELFLNGTQSSSVFSQITTNDYTANLNTKTIVNGLHTLKVCAHDTSANSSCSSTIQVTVNNGNTWKQVSSARTSYVWGSSSTDVWFGSNDGLKHWDGQTLTSVHLDTTIQTVSFVWGLNANDVWVNTIFSMFRWNGTTWTSVPHPSQNGISSMWGSKQDDIWASDFSRLYHWNGVSWSKVTTPIDNESYLYFKAVWGSGPNDVWVVGWSGMYPTQDFILRWDGVSWTRVAPPFTDCYLDYIWGTGANDIWLLSTSSAYVLHWDGTNLTQDSMWRGGTQDHVTAVWGPDSTETWAVDSFGRVYHRSASVWLTTPTAISSLSLNGIWGSNNDDIWAVGLTGIYHYGP